MKILITGSSGYIGSVVAKQATLLGHEVYGVDWKAPSHTFCQNFMVGDIGAYEVAKEVIDKEITTIFHLAASADVTDSVSRPSLYYHNNLGATAWMFDNLIQLGWKGQVISSSTAAVYGPSDEPQVEDYNINPTNSYGRSKLMCEMYLMDLFAAHEIPVINFRYFNVAGAYDDVGDHFNSGHVLQKLCHSASNDEPFFIFGTDYDTRDGTCIRDFVHVRDVSEAHFHGLKYLTNNPGYYTFNLGSKEGMSVKELATRFIERTGKTIKVFEYDRRPGDPSCLVANPDFFKQETNFEYNYTNIDTIIDSAWFWYRSKNAF